MKNFIADRFQGLKSTLSFNADAVSKYKDLIDLSIGDPDLVTDSKIIDKAMLDAKKGYTKYGDPKGDPELISAIIEQYKEDWNMDITREEVVVTPSSCMGMALVMFALLNPGDEVIVLSPYFSVYKQQIEVAGGVCVEVPTFQEDNWDVREDLLRAAFSGKTKALILNNPVNPTGAVFSLENLEMISKVAKEKDILVIADEIYTDYVFEGSFKCLRSFDGMAERTVTLNSFSKNYLMTGWRVGYIVADSLLVQTIQRINGAMIYTSPSISQRAAIEAIAIREETREKYINIYKDRVKYAETRINKISFLSTAPAAGTFYVFPSIKATGLSSQEFVSLLLEKCHILVSPGIAFGKAGEGHIRFSLTRPLEDIKEAFDRIERMFD